MNFKKIIARPPAIFNLLRFGDYAFQPFFLLIHLTLACNQRCPDCYQLIDNFYQPLQKQFISVENFKKILAEARRFWFRPRIHFFGGEPLLHPDFAALLRLTNRAGFESSITTNGILLKKYLSEITNSHLDQINISLFFPDQSPEILKSQLEKLKPAISQLKNNTAGKKIINFNCVISEDNYNRLTAIAQEIARQKLLINALVFQHPYFDRQRPPRIDLKILGSQIKHLKKMKSDSEIIFIPRLKINGLENFYYQDGQERFKNDCLIPWLGLNILPDLRITPGGGVLGCNQVVGDLKQDSLKNIWHSQSMRNFRRAIINQQMPTACFHCCHRRYY